MLEVLIKICTPWSFRLCTRLKMALVLVILWRRGMLMKENVFYQVDCAFVKY